jgi:NADH:ubiquinone oxidoreductase subunit 3 (subunit A)
VYFLVVVLAVAGLLVLSWLLGERHRERATVIPYESGMLAATGQILPTLLLDYAVVGELALTTPF